jgi:hypothetical protein
VLGGLVGSNCAMASPLGPKTWARKQLPGSPFCLEAVNFEFSDQNGPARAGYRDCDQVERPVRTSYMGVLTPNDPVLLEKGGPFDWKIYRDLRRDGKVFGGLQKRTNALIGRPGRWSR